MCLYTKKVIKLGLFSILRSSKQLNLNIDQIILLNQILINSFDEIQDVNTDTLLKRRKPNASHEKNNNIV